MLLIDVEIGKPHVISHIDTGNEEMDEFLFSLGCYSGEEITVVAHMSNTYVAVIRDGRYSLDSRLASCITVE